jgi:hypothetical protein
MDNHLADDEWVAQPITFQPWAHPLQYAAINNHLADDELLAQRTKRWALAHLQIK